MLARYQIPNGRSKGRQPSDFDPAQLRVGTKVEMEHTTDRRVAQRIAMDHLTEDRDYYKKLATIHLDGIDHLDCRKEIVKFRDSKGKLVQFTRRVGKNCPKRGKPQTRHLRPYQYKKSQLGDAACSTSPRWLRGGIGFLLGGVIGSMIGGGLAVAVTTAKADVTAPFATVATARRWWLIGSGITTLTALGGLWIGAAKPEC